MSKNFPNENGKIIKIDGDSLLIYLIGGPIGVIASFFIPANDNILIKAAMFIAGSAAIYFWWKNKDSNKQYIIDSKNDLFFIPLNDEPFCKLSEIVSVNRRQESKKSRESFFENNKVKYRTVTKYKYCIHIIGEDISADFDFDSQQDRDHLYSALIFGIKDVKNFMNHNY